MPPTTPAQPNILIHCIRTSAGKTAAAVQHSRAPLHASTLYRASPLLGPDALSIALVHAGGALLPGDALAVDLRLDPGAHLHLTTVGATCIHGPSPRVPQAPPSLLHTRYSVAAGAALVVLPHAIIPFARATLQTTTDLCLDDGAFCAIGEIMAAGRIARDEFFAFRDLSSTLILSRNGQILAMDRLRLQPLHACADTLAMHPHAALSWGAYTHLATLWLSAPWAGDALAARLHAEIQHLAPGAGPAMGSATHTQGPVVLVRLLGHSAQSLKVILEQLSAIALHEGRAQPCTGSRVGV